MWTRPSHIPTEGNYPQHEARNVSAARSAEEPPRWPLGVGGRLLDSARRASGERGGNSPAALSSVEPICNSRRNKDTLELSFSAPFGWAHLREPSARPIRRMQRGSPSPARGEGNRCQKPSSECAYAARADARKATNTSLRSL